MYGADAPGAPHRWRSLHRSHLSEADLASATAARLWLAFSGVTSIWVESLSRNFEEALNLMQAAVQDCTDELWETSMWPVPRIEGWWGTLRGPDGTIEGDPAVQDQLIQRSSAPWFRAWHALECLDYDLAGEMEPWKPPAPFERSYTGDVSRVWTRPEILGYVQWCRDRVRTTLELLTDEKAASPLPPAHRYGGQPYAWIISGLPGHTVEHASQIRQFTNDCRCRSTP